MVSSSLNIAVAITENNGVPGKIMHPEALENKWETPTKYITLVVTEGTLRAQERGHTDDKTSYYTLGRTWKTLYRKVLRVSSARMLRKTSMVIPNIFRCRSFLSPVYHCSSSFESSVNYELPPDLLQFGLNLVSYGLDDRSFRTRNKYFKMRMVRVWDKHFLFFLTIKQFD